MSLFKRRSTWWIDFTTPSGERIRCTANTEDKNQAQELHDKLKSGAWRVSKLGEKPKRTWDEAAFKGLAETRHKATHEQDKGKFRWLQQYLRGRLLEAIDRELIAVIDETKAQQSSPATAMRIWPRHNWRGMQKSSPACLTTQLRRNPQKKRD